MSEIEKLEAEYRRLVTKVIYASFKDGADPADRARMERMFEELLRLNAYGAADRAKAEVAAA